MESHKKLRAERNALREAVAWCYQMAGANDAPVWVLDNLSALANGEKAPHEWLPVTASELQQEHERLRKALEPFALLNDFISEYRRDSEPIKYRMDGALHEPDWLTVKDVREARAALGEKE